MNPIASADQKPDSSALGEGFRTGKVALLNVLLGALVLWAFLPAVRNGFVNYDDYAYVVTNPQVQGGLTWGGVWWAFTHECAANWHPLTMISHMADCQIFGLRAWGHHLTNVVLHVANTLLLFLVCRRMTGALWRSFLVAALFGLHPTHVESVAWAAERKDVLSTFFWMLTLWAYVRYAEEGRINPAKSKKFRRLALLFFALGLMSKPMVVTLPFVLLLLDYWPLGRIADWGLQTADSGERGGLPLEQFTLAKLVWEKAPFFALAGLSSVVTFLVQRQAGAVVAMTRLTLWERVGNALVSYGRYIGKLFYPARLSIFYPYNGHWPPGKVLLAMALLLGITVFVIARRRRSPVLAVGWFWFLGTLMPVIGLVQVGAQSMADRYLYIPSIGVFMMVAWGLPEWAERGRWQRWMTASGAAVLIIVCGLLTRTQIGYWKNGVTLFRHVLAVTPSNCLPHYTLGDALLKEGRLDEAGIELREALRLKPDYADALNDLALLEGQLGHSGEAIARFQEAIRTKPDYVKAHYNLGMELQKAGRQDEAIAQFQEAIKLDSEEPDAHNNLGMALAAKGLVDEAIREFEIATDLSPFSVEARFNLGYELKAKGRYEEAITEFKELLKRHPNDPETHYQLGLVWAATGQREEAAAQFAEALRVRPNYPAAQEQLRRLNETSKP